MLKRAMDIGIDASYVLMDTWFTQQPLIKAIKDQSLDVIGMVKKLNQRYLINGKRVSLEQLYRVAKPSDGKNGILRSIHITQANGIPVKVLSIRNRNKKATGLQS